MDDQVDKPGARPIDIETMFGDPEAMDKAAAAAAGYDVCRNTGRDIHCPWYKPDEGCTLKVVCPGLGGESAVG